MTIKTIKDATGYWYTITGNNSFMGQVSNHAYSRRRDAVRAAKNEIRSMFYDMLYDNYNYVKDEK